MSVKLRNIIEEYKILYKIQDNKNKDTQLDPYVFEVELVGDYGEFLQRIAEIAMGT